MWTSQGITTRMQPGGSDKARMSHLGDATWWSGLLSLGSRRVVWADGLCQRRRARSKAWPGLHSQQLQMCVKSTVFFGAESVPSHACPSSIRAVSLRCQNSYISKKKELIFMPDLRGRSIFMLLMEYQSCLLVCFIHKLLWRQLFFFKVFFLKWIACSFDEVVPPPGYTSVPHYAPVTPLIYKLW